ncbi:MAG: hypothetical protein IT373_20925 [Polyangiaceae bacterium]|nr:hypothetical protein [Polyangiaceae bacterium]
MLVSVRHLVDRWRHPRSRADELASLRARFAAQPGRFGASAPERALALELRARRGALAAAFGQLAACRSCARGRPLPAGRWPGGACCGARTLDLFSPDEVGALKLGGTRAAALEPPRGDHAGCAFRGAEGCTLAPEDRPNVCVRYVCLELRRELHARPDWWAVARQARDLGATFERFCAARRPPERPWDELRHG